MPDAIVVIGTDGTIRLLNRQAEALFGHSPAAVVGRPIEVLVPEESRSAHPAFRDGYFSNPQFRPMGAGRELSALKADGTRFPAEISLSAITLDEQPLVCAAVRDVSERKGADARFRGLLEAAPDGMVGVDSRGRIVFVNGQAERMFGYSRNDLLGQPVEVLAPESVRDMHPAHRARYFQAPTTRPMGVGLQLAGRRRDGTEFPAEISLSSLEGADGTVVIAAVRDVSERKRIEAEREQLQARQSERLEVLGQLAGGIAHDFNNLLAMILSYGRFVARQVADDENLRDDVNEILAAAERAAALTRQLLIFGRREVVRPEVLDLNEVVRSMERLLRRTIGEHITLETDFGEGVPEVFADPGQMEQVILNLALNARDAMPNGGRLTFRTEPRIERTAESVRARALLTITDNGQGMPVEVRTRAFEPFFTTKPKGQGTGLGLATVHSIILQAGGDIDLYSDEGIGTVFRILLPAADPEAHARTEDQPEVPPRGNGETILVVEDEAGVRDVTCRILRDYGYEVVAAADPVKALALARSGAVTPAVLLTDVVMPGMSGKDLAAAFRSFSPDTPVVYMSGYSHDVIVHQGVLDAGVVLVQKPFTEQELLAAVSAALAPPAPDQAAGLGGGQPAA
jgi:PAS domain S-box-containing protein